MHKHFKRGYLLILLSLTITLVLAACGDTPTATPAATTKAATTAAATTAAPTTAAATTAAPTTAAPTTAATTAAATTAAATTRAATASTGLTFTPFTSQTGNFTIMMPGKATESVTPTDVAGYKLSLYQYTVQLDNVDAVYYATYIDYPAGIKLDPAVVVKGSLDGQVGKDGTLLSSKDVTLGQLNGKEAEILRSGVYFKVRIFYTSNRLYQLIVGYPSGKQDTASIDTFLKSFQLITPPVATTAADNFSTTEIAFDPAIVAGFTKLLSGTPDLLVKLFVSETTAPELSQALDKYIIASGYQFALPNETKPLKSPNGTAYASFYTKAGLGDVLIGVMAISDNPTQLAANLKDLNLPGYDQADQAKLAAQLKGHKSLSFSVVGTGIGKTLFAANSAATPTAAPATSATTEIAIDPMITSAITKLAAGVTDLDLALYVSDSTPEALAMTSETTVVNSGYKYAVPGGTTVTRYGTAYSGGYSKAGAPDIFFLVATLSDDPTQLAKNLVDLGVPGFDQADQAKFQAQIKGHKSLLLILTGTNLGKTLSK